MNKKRILLILFMALFVANNAMAKVAVVASCRYSDKTGSSQYLTLNVYFVTGAELNRAMGTSRYFLSANYAVIWLNQEQCAIVQIGRTSFPALPNLNMSSMSINDMMRLHLILQQEKTAPASDGAGNKSMPYNLPASRAASGYDNEGRYWQISW